MKLYQNLNFIAILLFITKYILVFSEKDNEILYEICIGSISQCFPISVDTLSFHTLINDNDEKFNKSASLSLRETKQSINSENVIRQFKGFVYQDYVIQDGSSSDRFYFVIGTDIKNLLGLALNYTDNVAVNERYFFGCHMKFSYIHHLYSNRQIKNKVFSIEENTIKIGLKHNDINMNNKCKCESNLEYGHSDFFWNCRFDEVMLGKEYKIGHDKKVVIDSTLKGISFPTSMVEILQNVLVSYTKGKCILKSSTKKISCKKNYNINSLPLLIFERSNIKIMIHSKNLFTFDQENESYYLDVKIEVFNDVILIGKLLFDNYYVEFNQDEGSLGFIPRHPIINSSDISSSSNVYSTVIFLIIMIVNLLSLGGIIISSYTKTIIVKKLIYKNEAVY